MAGVYQLPRLAAIVGPIQPAVGIMSLDQRVHPIGIRRYCDSDLSVRSFGKSVLFQMFPGRAAIVGPVNAAARTTAGHAPRGAPRLPQRSKENVGIVRIKGNVYAAGVLLLVENFLPCLPAIGCAENAALRVGPKGMPQRRHEGNVGIRGIDDHLADRARITQANVLPRLSA